MARALTDRSPATPRARAQASRARRKRPRTTPTVKLSPSARRCRAKFLRFFPKGFYDPLYDDWERGYKWEAHKRWAATLDRDRMRALLRAGKHADIAARAVAIEARTNLLFSFEKMALRDAVKSPAGARKFAQGLYDFLHGAGDMEQKFEHWCEVVAALPRRQTRVLTWPIVTVMGFIAQPQTCIYLKPTVTREAARQYGFPFHYQSRPSWRTYASLLDFTRTVRADLRALRPRDMIDIQSFLWVQGSDEFAE
jgi:hypothetical protein